MTEDLLSEIPESQATGDIAEIYRELRQALGVPNVNLVFRHMATVDGCLPWAWGYLSELYRSAPIHAVAKELCAQVQFSPVHRRTPPTGAPRDGVIGTLDSYIRANPINMIGLLLSNRALDDKCGKHIALPSSSFSVQIIKDILPMPALSQVPASVSKDLSRLAQLLHQVQTNVVPSLFRHFAPWPSTLKTIEDVLSALQGDGTLDRFADMMLTRSNDAMVHLYHSPHEPPNLASAQSIRSLAKIFPRNMAKATIVALMLKQAWYGE